MEARFEVPPTPEVQAELDRRRESFSSLMREAKGFLEDPAVDELALARMYIERGWTEDAAHWLVREAMVERAPGTGTVPTETAGT